MNIKKIIIVVGLHSQNGGMKLEEQHCVVSFPDQEAPALEEIMGWGYGETVQRARSLLLALYSGAFLQ